MKCIDCPYYSTGFMWNGCSVTASECFPEQDDCALVNEDGTINENDPYFIGGE